MSAAARLRVGFLHVGRERSGLRRYGRILAVEAATRPDLDVIESDAGGRSGSWADLRRAAGELRGADVVHLQWKLADWDPRLGGIPRMEVVLASLRRPMVVTLHDVFERRGLWERTLSPAALGMRRLGRRATALVVHSDEERRRLEGSVPSSKVEVIPHFVERRSTKPDRAQARAALELGDHQVVTLLGFMTKRRGHALVIDALSTLPEDVVALFVGAPIEGRDHMLDGLQKRAEGAGVGHRVRFLGYVPDETLEQVLAATDVALCPFREMSASGALATWISAGRPIVTSDLPPFRELDVMQPGALRIFHPYTAEALAEGIRRALASAEPRPDPAVEALAARLATPRILDHYLRLYRAAADP